MANDARSAVEKEENSLPNHPMYGRVDEKGVNFSAAMQQERKKILNKEWEFRIRLLTTVCMYVCMLCL